MKKKNVEGGGVETPVEHVTITTMAPVAFGETAIARRIGHVVGATTAVVTIFSMGATATWMVVTMTWTIAGSWLW